MRPGNSTIKDNKAGDAKVPNHSANPSQLEPETDRKLYPLHTYVFMHY